MFPGGRRWDSRRYGVRVSGSEGSAAGRTVANATLEHGSFVDSGVSLGSGAAVFAYRCEFSRGYPVVLDGRDNRAVIYQSSFQGHWTKPRFIGLAELRGTTAAQEWTPVAGQRDGLLALLHVRTELDLERVSKTPWADWPKTHVLVLGDFAPEHRTRLDLMADCLRRRGYEPTFVDGVEDIRQHDLQAKVLLLAGVCRFSMIDDSSRGGQLTEIGLLRQANRSAAILRLNGTYSSAMATGLAGPGSRIHEFRYDVDKLDDVVGRAVAALERDVNLTEEYLDGVYPWRSGDGPGELPALGVAPIVSGLPL